MIMTGFSGSNWLLPLLITGNPFLSPVTRQTVLVVCWPGRTMCLLSKLKKSIVLGIIQVRREWINHEIVTFGNWNWRGDQND